MAGSVPTYQGPDQAVKRWSESLASFLNTTFLDLYKIVEREPVIKNVTITATGTTLIGGITFDPSAIILLARDSSIDSSSYGLDNGANHHCVYSFLNGSNVTQAAQSSLYSIYLTNNAASSLLTAYVSAKNSTSLTITSSVTGTISAEVKLLIFP